MLKQRTLTALVLAPVCVAAVLWLPTAVVAALAGALFLVGAWEWGWLAGHRGQRERGAMLAAVAVLLAVIWWQRSATLSLALLILAVAWWLAALVWLRHFSFAASPTRDNAALKLLAGALALIPAWMALVWLHGHASHGRWLLLALLIIWAADTGAYFSGRRFGRRKLAPRISPGKTWAGVYGALAGAAIIAAIGGVLLLERAAGIVGLVVLALVTVAASIAGDLFESLLKRHALVKDSGALFPGHGGLLDRMDSVVAALPVFALGLWIMGV
ncbi:MAG TPA: phosphatidate cytidylyltransferase [Rhodanobacteraceae bacterium]|nr:phosphatidate cytidylyltransferase [Rhodanobacteraceae bacterium]